MSDRKSTNPVSLRKNTECDADVYGRWTLKNGVPGDATAPPTKREVAELVENVTPYAFVRRRPSQLPAALQPLHRLTMGHMWVGDDRTTVSDKEAIARAMRQLYPPAKRKQTGVCHRCDGRGVISAFKHIHGGTCFRCEGTGVFNPPRETRIERVEVERANVG